MWENCVWLHFKFSPCPSSSNFPLQWSPCVSAKGQLEMWENWWDQNFASFHLECQSFTVKLDTWSVNVIFLLATLVYRSIASRKGQRSVDSVGELPLVGSWDPCQIRVFLLVIVRSDVCPLCHSLLVKDPSRVLGYRVWDVSGATSEINALKKIFYFVHPQY